jgi:hypothetical protein
MQTQPVKQGKKGTKTSRDGNIKILNLDTDKTVLLQCKANLVISNQQ